MYQRIRQPLRASTRSILSRILVMVAMVHPSCHGARRVGRRRLVSVSDGGPWARWALRQRRVVIGCRSSASPLRVPVCPPGRRAAELACNLDMHSRPPPREASVIVVTERGVRSRRRARPFPRMANEPDHLLLRRYVVARERGREAEAAQIWERLTENNFDRITLLC